MVDAATDRAILLALGQRFVRSQRQGIAIAGQVSINSNGHDDPGRNP